MQRTKVMHPSASMGHQITGQDITHVECVLKTMFLVAYGWHKACVHLSQGHSCNAAGSDFRTKASA